MRGCAYTYRHEDVHGWVGEYGRYARMYGHKDMHDTFGKGEFEGETLFGAESLAEKGRIVPALCSQASRIR